MTFPRLILEVLPVLLAVIAIFACANRAILARRAHERRVYLGMVICSVLMIVAQSSWTYTILKGMSEATDFANMLWSCFNAGVMAVFIASTRRTK